MSRGILFIISAPSGTGKSSLIQGLLKLKPLYNIQVSISHTTRIIRPGELHGKHYYFISQKKFQKMIKEECFLEHAKVFSNFYGTSRQFIEEMLLSGKDVFLDIDWQGAKQIRDKMPESKSIFLLPPSKDTLYKRLKERGQDSEVVIAKRMEKAVDEMKHYSEYDYLIINDDFKKSIDYLKTIISAEHLCLSHQKNKFHILISNLLKP
ncbi:guanylate kinase [Buchnera aphidicola]|uniref:Guanylate kinase n=1 Tax=Buchnera aphidicola str. USDA (Myzus persicae) TaxID=1009856 RepID=W0NZN6_BUCMP|nr:guanylate kinase [Buchnera aphidicola]AHG59961.1 Gmk [Buchnera aphidicola str. USDA (Myzus persicae)]AHG60541.1 Gmk [Buchnera aphidicola str. W106 (Myzus persicae)]AHG61114.1 Gmk [Buchnera aphidicola str. G002 (Myzus persicae)]AHG61686.1 Gmk [Buchnera aphidicola str. F009 (Myzus persicae)]WAI03356.1 MAG: guanylate kinase [Buchnera aphidicola (Myzus persicae)]